MPDYEFRELARLRLPSLSDLAGSAESKPVGPYEEEERKEGLEIILSSSSVSCRGVERSRGPLSARLSSYFQFHFSYSAPICPPRPLELSPGYKRSSLPFPIDLGIHITEVLILRNIFLFLRLSFRKKSQRRRISKHRMKKNGINQFSNPAGYFSFLRFKSKES